MKKYLTMSVILLMVVALVAVSANCSSTEEEVVTYKVGALFSTTGGASNLGVPEENTVNMVVDQINDAGGSASRWRPSLSSRTKCWPLSGPQPVVIAWPLSKR
jgi:hypothetical protein